jgi:hypothetical protein
MRFEPRRGASEEGYGLLRGLPGFEPVPQDEANGLGISNFEAAADADSLKSIIGITNGVRA